MAQITPDPVNPQQPPKAEEFKSPSEVTKAGALQLCISDAQTAEAWLASNYWPLRWRESDALYQALALDTLVRAKNGFIPIKDIHPGDEVFGRDGKLHKVIGESPVFENRPCFELAFNTGETIVADACHLWETVVAQQTHGLGRGKNPNSRLRGLPKQKRSNYTAVRSTEEIAKTCFYGKLQRHNHRIKLTDPLDCSEKSFSIDPYTLGVWLGDGDSDAPRITSADMPIIQELERIENRVAKETLHKPGAAATRYAFTCYEMERESLETRLRKLGVLSNKHIPEAYFNGSHDQRLSLIQGLLDTDGSCVRAGHATFRNTNQSLAIGVKRLVCSLGFRATLKRYDYDRYSDGCVYSVHFTPPAGTPFFRLPRKSERQKDKSKSSKYFRSIIRVTPIAPKMVKCISVEGEFFLVTDGLIVTHNSPPGVFMWEGTTVPRANVNRFAVAETVNAIHPQIMNGLFYEQPAFVLRPRPNQKEDTNRSISALLSVQFDEMKFRQESDWLLHSALLFGTGIGKWGYRSYTKKTTKFVRSGNPVQVPSAIPGQPSTEINTPQSDEFEKREIETPVHTPFFENKDIRYVLVDPSCHVPDIRKGRFVIDRMYMTYRDLIKLKEEKYVVVDKNGKRTEKNRYDLPSEAEIKSWFTEPQEEPQTPGNTDALYVQGTTFVHHAKALFQKTTADPLDEPLEVLERWDNDKVITVLQRVKCIRNEENEFGVIPFLSVNWWNIPDAFWGLGLGRTIGAEQRVQQGIINACLDLASLIVNPMFVRARGANISTQQIRQRIGGIVDADIGLTGNMPKSTREALTLLEQPQIPTEIVQQIALSEGRVEKTAGANQQLTMGASAQGHSQGQMGRSGTGAAGLIQANMNRIGGFAESFVRQIYEPLIYKMHELNRDKTPIAYIRQVLGVKLGPEFKFDPEDFLNAPAEFEVLAGSHLAAKAQMAQSLFMMIQLFENQPLMDQLNKISQKKVNIEELFHMIHDISGWKNYYDIIVDLTAQEKMAMQQQNPALQKLQGQMTLNNQKFQQDQQLIDQENDARAARDIFRQIAEKASLPQALTGAESPDVGLGSQETG